jgi:hypothetical protein
MSFRIRAGDEHLINQVKQLEKISPSKEDLYCCMDENLGKNTYDIMIGRDSNITRDNKIIENMYVKILLYMEVTSENEEELYKIEFFTDENPPMTHYFGLVESSKTKSTQMQISKRIEKDKTLKFTISSIMSTNFSINTNSYLKISKYDTENVNIRAHLQIS